MDSQKQKFPSRVLTVRRRPEDVSTSENLHFLSAVENLPIGYVTKEQHSPGFWYVCHPDSDEETTVFAVLPTSKFR